MSKKKYYLAGPMTGRPQFNFPAFFAAAEDLRRSKDKEIISPAELDDAAVVKNALASKDGSEDSYGGSLSGDPTAIKDTWGDFLARDVKLIADTIDGGIVVLPEWETSKGARLEVFVGLLKGLPIYKYKKEEDGTFVIQIPNNFVMEKLSESIL